MNEAQQRKQIHLSLSPRYVEKLDNLRRKEQFPSRSRVIEYLLDENAIGSKIDALINIIESSNIHKRSIAGGKGDVKRDVVGKCELSFCKNKADSFGKWYEYDVETGEMVSKEINLCNKHYQKGLLHEKNRHERF